MEKNDLHDQKQFETQFNELLVDTFHLILKTELKMIKDVDKNNLSMREIHLLEIIGKAKDGISISNIAKAFQITLASVTVMVQKLEKQNLLEKNKHSDDKRIVLMVLTEEGKKIDRHHFNFHKKMVQNITKNITDFERKVLFEGVTKLNSFFNEELKK